jgi:superoxide dismutase, Cu-Zn family
MKKILAMAVFAAGMALGAGHLFAEEAAPLKAVCELKPTKGNKVSGVVKFIQRKGYVTVRAHVTGLTPGWHGFHIHESGDCSAPDASSAKGHFNPGKHDHGSPTAKTRHAGDLGNLKANDKGVAYYDRDDATITLSGKDNIIGKGIIVHEKVDDYKTQPTGNAGARVACGKIELKKEEKKKK